MWTQHKFYISLLYFLRVWCKLMWLGSPNQIDDFESISRSEFDCRFGFQRFRSNRRLRFWYKINCFRYKFDLLIDLNLSNVNYLIENGRFISKICRFHRKSWLSRWNQWIFDQNWWIFNIIELSRSDKSLWRFRCLPGHNSNCKSWYDLDRISGRPRSNHISLVWWCGLIVYWVCQHFSRPR